MVLHASFCSSRSFQAARLRNTSPLMRSSPVMRASQPLRTCQEQSTYYSPGSSLYHDMSRFLHVSDNDDDGLSRKTSDGCQLLFGLGIVLPASVSHPAVRHDCAKFVNDKDVVVTHVQTMKPTEFVRSEIVHKMPQKPVLRPVDAQDEISPILPLPPSIDTARRTPGTSTSLAELICEVVFPTDKIPRHAVEQLSIADQVCANICTSDPIITEDTTCNLIRDECCAKQLGDLTRSSFDEASTVDIAEEGLPLDHGTFGLSCLSGPLCENGSAISHDDGLLDKRITNGTPISPCASPYALQLCSFPIYHNKPRGCGTGLSLSGTDRGLTPRTSVRHVRSSIIIRDPVIRAQRRNTVSRRPIEVSSPSMTPSPTSSPQFFMLPLGSEHRTGSLTRHPPYMQSSSKPSRHHSSPVCPQTVRARSSKCETIWTSTRRGATHSPKTRPHIISDRSACAPLRVTRGDGDNAFLARTRS